VKLRVITNSELSTRRRCPREHFYAYIQGYRSLEDAAALVFGTRWHRGMEPWWLGRPVEEAIDAALSDVEDPYEAAKFRVLLRGYDLRWRAETDFGDVVAVEREFRAPLVNPETGAASRTYQRGGKLDVLHSRSFTEHKTTSDEIGFGSVYWRVLTLNSQVSTYYAGARAMGHEVDECVYDVVRKPGQRPSQVPIRCEAGFKVVHDANGERVYCKATKKSVGPKPRETADAEQGWVLQTRIETPDEFEARLLEEVAGNPDKYFQRGKVVRLEHEEREAALDVWQLARTMREDELAGRHPKNSDACRRGGQNMCPFFLVCCGEAQLEDKSKFVKVANVHQELSSDAAE
jgi:hypothetical protein